MDPHKITREERIVEVDDSTVKLTDLELRLEAVAYLFKSNGTAARVHYAGPGEVLRCRSPKAQFQVSPATYRSMRERARRIQALLAGGEKSHLT